MKTFPHLDVKGSARARGQAHGEAFRERIQRTFDFYMDDLFSASPLSRAAIRTRADQIEALTARLAPTAADQITGIASGAGLEAWKLFVLNGRTEILNARVTECTSSYDERLEVRPVDGVLLHTNHCVAKREFYVKRGPGVEDAFKRYSLA